MNDYIVFDGVDSRTFGVYLFDRGNDNAPERIYSRYEIPAKNGDLLIDEKRYENVIVQYDLIAFGAGLEGRVQKFKGFMKSRIGYKRLEDSFRPEEYYMACQAAEIEVAYDRERERCRIELTFDRQPQRFLKVGETQVDVDDWKNVKTVSGAIASFDNDEEDVDIKSIVASIVPVQSGSGDPSPTNIRAITGWTGANVIRTGRNIFGGNLLRDGIKAAIPTASDHADIRAIDYDVTVPAYGSFTKAASLDGKFKENTAYTFIVTLETTQSRSTNMRIYYTDGTHINIPNVSGINTKETKVVVTSPNKTVQNIYRVYSDTSVTRVYYDESGLFEGVLTLSDFEQYIGNTYPITWSEAGTVYGGTLDVVSGTLTVTMAVVDLGTLTWGYLASSNLFSTNVSGKKPGITGGVVSQYTNGGWWSGWANKDCVWCGNAANNGFVVKDTAYTDAATFKAAMSGVQFVYELAEPVTYQLTPTEITTLIGENNISADCGDVTVEYGKSMGIFKNPSYFDAYPLIRVEGTGTVTIGNNTITISENDGHTDIDCQLMEAYKGSTSRNAYVSFSGFEPPSLKEGVTTIGHSSGITSVKVIPRWWRL